MTLQRYALVRRSETCRQARYRFFVRSFRIGLLGLSSTGIGIESVMRLVKFAALASGLAILIPLVPYRVEGDGNLLLWMIDLASHWQWLYVAVLLVCAPLLAWKDKRWLMLIVLTVLPWFTASSTALRANHDGPTLTVIVANVNAANQNPATFIDWLNNRQADVVAVLEVSPQLGIDLEKLVAFPHRVIRPRNDAFGIALLSRFPLSDIQVIEDNDGIPHIEAQVAWPKQAFDIVVFHPMPPMAPEFHALRDVKLTAIARHHKDIARPIVVAGDLNATPWSSAFTGLDELGLRRTGDLSPTWPAMFDGWFGIPIDHLLVSPEWRVNDAYIGPDIGSDHLPIAVVLQTSSAATMPGR